MANTYHLTRYGHTYKIAVDDEFMEHHYRRGELCEYHMLDWIQKHVPPGGVWVDAGANVGNHSLFFATAMDADLVLAFEPADVNYSLLLENTRPYVNIVPQKLGVGSKVEMAGIRLGGTGKNCQFELHTPTDEADATIPVLPIDSLVPRYNVRCLKLDVEGMEILAITGAWETIKLCLPEIFVEVWKRHELDLIIATLGVLGYKLIERYNVAPTYHFSVRPYKVTYTEPPAV